MLSWKQISIPFGQGLAEHTAPYLIKPGRAYVAEQAILDKDGTIQIRPGTSALSSNIFNYGGDPNTLKSGAHLFSHKSETLMTTPYRLLSYQDADDQWQDIDDAYEVDIRRVIKAERAGADGYEDYSADCAVAGNWIAYAWVNKTANTLNLSFVDYYTGAHVETKTWAYPAGAGFSTGMVRLVVAGGLLHMFWHDEDNAQIWDYFFDYTNLETANGSLVVGGQATTYGQFDACVNTDGEDGYVYLAYAHVDGFGAPDGVMCVKVYDTGASVHSFDLEPLKAAPDFVNAQVGLAVDDNAFWCAYDTVTAEINAFAKSSVTISITLQTAISVRSIYSKGSWSKVTVATPGSTQDLCLIVWEQDAQGATTATGLRIPSLDAVTMTDSGVVVDGHKTWGAGLLSRPWYYNNTPYIVGYFFRQQVEDFSGTYATSYQRNAYVLEIRIGVKTQVVE